MLTLSLSMLLLNWGETIMSWDNTGGFSQDTARESITSGQFDTGCGSNYAFGDNQKDNDIVTRMRANESLNNILSGGAMNQFCDTQTDKSSITFLAVGGALAGAEAALLKLGKAQPQSQGSESPTLTKDDLLQKLKSRSDEDSLSSKLKYFDRRTRDEDDGPPPTMEERIKDLKSEDLAFVFKMRDAIQNHDRAAIEKLVSKHHFSESDLAGLQLAFDLALPGDNAVNFAADTKKYFSGDMTQTATRWRMSVDIGPDNQAPYVTIIPFPEGLDANMRRDTIIRD
jgi:hypothetical protein